MIHIAMIEDDEQLAYILTAYLKQFDIEVTNFSDPFIGLSSITLDKNKFDLIILDLTLPGLDGIDVCKDLIKLGIPIIISSARSDIEDKIKTIEIGADDYLAKPYEPRELELRIRSVLRRYNFQKEKRYKQQKQKKQNSLKSRNKPYYLKMNHST